MLAVARACAIIGLEGIIVEVQTDFNPRAVVPMFTIVGLPDNAVKESRERVRAAIKNSQLQFPPKAFVVNLSPADLPKHSTAYDLAIAIGVLGSTDQVPLHALEDTLFVGELSLDGAVRHVKGALAMAYAAQQAGMRALYLPAADAPEAALIGGIDVYPVQSLGQLVEHLYGLNPIAPFRIERAYNPNGALPPDVTDFAAIKGQQHVKRALEIAAAGGHNVLMSGAPGSGKTLLARAMVGILPTMILDESLEVTRIYSVADMLSSQQPLIQQRPFRAPHHTISPAGMIGGGTIPRPGEVTLAHNGILFLDEALEMPGYVLEVLRQPIEDRIVTISRARGSLTFPANFTLVLAINPCPCGYYGDAVKPCSCTPQAITRYQSRLSGPLLDRIDLHVDVPRVEYDKLLSNERAESSESIRQRVEHARVMQRERFADLRGIHANADMGASELEKFCILTSDARQLLDVSVRRLQVSARSYHRLLKLCRTLADIEGVATITAPHVAEALQYRPKMRN